MGGCQIRPSTTPCEARITFGLRTFQPLDRITHKGSFGRPYRPRMPSGGSRSWLTSGLLLLSAIIIARHRDPKLIVGWSNVQWLFRVRLRAAMHQWAFPRPEVICWLNPLPEGSFDASTMGHCAELAVQSRSWLATAALNKLRCSFHLTTMANSDPLRVNFIGAPNDIGQIYRLVPANNAGSNLFTALRVEVAYFDFRQDKHMKMSNGFSTAAHGVHRRLLNITR
ncbi:hypothetical protein CEK25_001368 [Fusarium fujikuroi]|nr:hypothetical protein CEK25_001368 [Fusarium fujikuroi]